MEERAVHQQTLAGGGFVNFLMKRFKKQFLDDMDRIVPLQRLRCTIWFDLRDR